MKDRRIMARTIGGAKVRGYYLYNEIRNMHHICKYNDIIKKHHIVDIAPETIEDYNEEKYNELSQYEKPI